MWKIVPVLVHPFPSTPAFERNRTHDRAYHSSHDAQGEAGWQCRRFSPVDNRCPLHNVSGRSALPPQIARYRDRVDDWDAFVDALHRPLPTDLRWNSLVVGRERFEDELRLQGLAWESMPGSPDVYRVADLAGPGLTFGYQHGW